MSVKSPTLGYCAKNHREELNIGRQMAVRSVSLCISLPTTRYAEHGNAVPSEGARDRRCVVAFRDVVS